MAAMPYLYMVHTIKYKMAWGVLEKIGRAIMNLNFAKFLLPTTYFIVVWSFCYFVRQWYCRLTHWGRVTHICVGKLTIIGSDNDLSPERRQAIIWTNAVNWTLGNKLQWNYSRNSNIFIEENTFENVVCEMLFISSRPQCVIPQWYCCAKFQKDWTT